MIDKGTFKRLVAPVVAGTVVVAAAAAVGGAGQLLLRLSTGGDTTQALQEVPELPASADLLAEWAPDLWDGDRELEPLTRRRIEAAYVRGVAAIGRYGATGDASGIEATFSGPAKQAALERPMQEATAIWSVSHRLELHFYALDGATVALRDTAAQIVRSTRIGDEDTLITTTEQYDVVFVLEDGYWRIRQLRRLGDDDLATVARVGGTGAEVTVLDGFDVPPARRPVPAMAGAGYQPAATPLELQWPSFDPTIAEIDLGRAAALGLDTIRVPYPFLQIGGADPTAGDLENLTTFLDIARDRGIDVVLTLFSDRADHTPNSWASDDHYVRTLAAAVGGHDALVMWDLGDSPDLATSPASPTEIRARLAHLASTLRAADPATPITVTWSSPEAAADPGMAEVVDVVSFRWSGGAGGLADAVGAVRDALGDVPLVLGAYGTHSWNGPLPGGRTEDDQAAATAAILRVARGLDLRGTFARSLYDLAAPPSLVPRPWSTGPLTHVGLLRADGTPKPVAALVRPGADLGVAPDASPLARRWLRVVAVGVLVLVCGRCAHVGRRRGAASGGSTGTTGTPKH